MAVVMLPYLLLITFPFLPFFIGFAFVLLPAKFKRKIKSWNRWLITDPWPLHLFPMFLIVHRIILSKAWFEQAQVNIVASSIFQGFGGLVVIVILSLNIGIITKTSLFDAFSQYLKRCPLFLKSRKISSFYGTCASVSNMSAVLAVGHKGGTIEEQIVFLKREVKRLETAINKVSKDVDAKITVSEQKLRLELRTLQMEIDETNITLKSVFTGGVKWEILGALSILYGLFIPIIYS